jgi:CheY-like chemotaxis protein
LFFLAQEGILKVLERTMPRILVVDDDQVDREAVERCLRGLNDIHLTFANEGEVALQLINDQLPDMVLTDLRMPKIDGLTLVEQLHDEHPSLPVVLMTSRGNEKIAVKALKAGAASYVPKRDLKTDLPGTIRQVWEVAESARKQGEVLKHLTGLETNFRIPNDATLITPIVGFLQDTLKRIGFGSESERTHVGIALMEALSNSMLHGNLEVDSELRREDPEAFERLVNRRQLQLPYSGRRVFLNAKETARKIEYIIRDEGPGFDPGALPDPVAQENLLNIAGRGIMLMCTFMDLVEYNTKGDQVRMVKEI